MSEDMDQKLFEVVTYLVTSAPTAYDETPALASFRMADAANRLLALMGDDEFVNHAREEFQAHLNEVMTNQPAFREWLTEYVKTFTKEAVRRNSTTA